MDNMNFCSKDIHVENMLALHKTMLKEGFITQTKDCTDEDLRILFKNLLPKTLEERVADIEQQLLNLRQMPTLDKVLGGVDLKSH